MHITCPNPECKQQLHLPTLLPGQKVRCSVCGREVAISTAAIIEEPLPTAELLTAPTTTSKQTSANIGVDSAPVPRKPVGPPPLPREFAIPLDTKQQAEANLICPGCRRLLAKDVVVCVDCGHDFRKGRKLARITKRVNTTWITGPSLQFRFTVLAVTVAVVLVTIVAMIIGFTKNPSFLGFCGALLVMLFVAFTVIYQVGTFVEFTLKHDQERELVLFARIWQCFYRSQRAFFLRDFTAIKLDFNDDAYWLFLVNQHDDSLVPVFGDPDEAKMRKLLKFLQRATDLPCERL